MRPRSELVYLDPMLRRVVVIRKQGQAAILDSNHTMYATTSSPKSQQASVGKHPWGEKSRNQRDACKEANINICTVSLQRMPLSRSGHVPYVGRS